MQAAAVDEGTGGCSLIGVGGGGQAGGVGGTAGGGGIGMRCSTGTAFPQCSLFPCPCHDDCAGVDESGSYRRSILFHADLADELLTGDCAGEFIAACGSLRVNIGVVSKSLRLQLSASALEMVFQVGSASFLGMLWFMSLSVYSSGCLVPTLYSYAI